MFCEVTDIVIPWKKITRGLPKGRMYADDRAPTLEEIHKIIEYPDRRMKPIVYTMASSGIRVGAWDHLKWNHISPIVSGDGKLVAAKINVYAGEDDEYITFITSEAYLSLQSWDDVSQCVWRTCHQRQLSYARPMECYKTLKEVRKRKD
jgi:hypothetical protein